MALKYGINLPASNYKTMLEKNEKQRGGIKTWQQLFGGASLGYEQETGSVTAAYSDAISQAYKTYHERGMAAIGSGLSQGSNEKYAGLTTQDLMSTYEKYIGNYATDISKAAQSYSSELGGIEQGLTERAENLSKLYSSAYKYLTEELAGASFLRNKLDEEGLPISVKEGEGRKLTDKLDEEGNVIYEQETVDYLREMGYDWLLDEEGNVMDWNQLAEKHLFTDEMDLTERGQTFFQGMFEADPRGYKREDDERARVFDEWLSETDPELREWLVSADEFNYNLLGTNYGTAKNLLGIDSLSSGDAVRKSSILDAEGKLQSFGSTLSKDKPEARNLSQIVNLDEPTRANDSKVRDKTRKYVEQYTEEVLKSVEDTNKDISELLGKELAAEFFNTYGTEYSTLKKQIEDYKQYLHEITKTRYVNTSYELTEEGYKYAPKGITSREDWQKNIDDALNKMTSLDTGKIFNDLQKNLERFLKEKRKETFGINRMGF